MGNNYCCVEKDKSLTQDYLATLIKADHIRVRERDEMPKMLRPTRSRRHTEIKPKQRSVAVTEDNLFTESPFPAKNIFDDESMWNQTKEELKNVRTSLV